MPSEFLPRLIRISLAAAALAFVSGCSSLVAWQGNAVPASPAARVRVAEARKQEQKELPPPSGLRPCCIFGTDVQVDVGEVSVPFVQLGNVVSASDLGRHQYDNGSSPVAVDDEGVFAGEKNGLVFTCEAGFVDVAHVRDYADLTLFLASRLEECLDGGCVIPLPSDGGDRYVVVDPLPASARAPSRRLATVIALARWSAFQLSIWHEIATGSGWSAFAAFPELASAFSPEDLFSNALGTQLGSDIILTQQAMSEGAYNDALTAHLAVTLKQLGAVPPDDTRAVLKELDGKWWDSKQRLPSARLVRKHNFNTGPDMLPLELPSETAQKWCAWDRRRETITMPTTVAGRPIGDFVTLHVEVARTERLRLPGPTPPWITQRSFPSLIAALKVALAKKGV